MWWRHLLISAVMLWPLGGPAAVIGDHGPPELVLWAWERPEDLRFLVGERAVAVAPLLTTLRLSSEGLEVLGRHHRLILPNRIDVTAVVRIEVGAGKPPELDAQMLDRVTGRILDAVSEPRPRVLQIDFDARHSERPFYRRLLSRLRNQLPADMGLEITALASWCLGDPWIRDLPIDAAVPMFFRMGKHGESIRRRLGTGAVSAPKLCEQNMGLSTDEPWPAVPPGHRVFLFHPKAWDAGALARARAMLGGSL